MKISFYVACVLNVFLTQDVYSMHMRSASRTVYYFPELKDECRSFCFDGGCITVNRNALRCSERFKSYTGKRCLGACSWRIGEKVYSCRVSDSEFEECSLTRKRERQQHYGRFFKTDKACITTCDSFGGTAYNWCSTGYRYEDWEYCSKTPGYSAFGKKCGGDGGCTYTSYSNTAECKTVEKKTEQCGAVTDHTVTSQIEYHYIGKKLVDVYLQYDARKLVDGNPIDKFIVLNITEPEIIVTDNGSRDRKKRYVCRAGCNPQTLSDTLTNLANELEAQHLNNNANNIYRINPDWAPFARPNDSSNRNPIQRSYVREIRPGVRRVEFVEAQIHLNHYNRGNRVDISQTDKYFMRAQRGVNSDHEAGHIVASVLGGPPDRYNFVPQHSAVNRNAQSREQATTFENDWFSVEQLMPEFFDNGQPGTRGGYIIWRVSIHYNSDDDYVPYMFQYLAQFYDENGVEYDDGVWFPTGGGTFNRQYF